MIVLSSNHRKKNPLSDRRPRPRPPRGAGGGGPSAAGGCGGCAPLWGRAPAGPPAARLKAVAASVPPPPAPRVVRGRCRRSVLARCLHLYRLVFTSVSAGVYICNHWRRWWVDVVVRMQVAPVKYYGGLPPLSASSPAALRPLLSPRGILPEKVPCTHPPAPIHHLGIVTPPQHLPYFSHTTSIFLVCLHFFLYLLRIYICNNYCLTLKFN